MRDIYGPQEVINIFDQLIEIRDIYGPPETIFTQGEVKVLRRLANFELHRNIYVLP